MSRPTARPPVSWLPREQTTFVGRAAELNRLGAMLTTSRLATVTGPGGVGKTRLALRAAAIAGPSFAGGARLTALSGLRDPELLPHTVAAALDLPEHDPRPRLEQVLEHLRDKHLLLILDTCEHLVDACALFAEAVLARTGRVTLLATSREPLCVPGEHEYPLAPLTVPGPGAGPGDGADALELFAQRAAAVAPGLPVASRAEMARLCRRLDGIPLAIELAAVQLRDTSLGELGRRVEQRFLDLAGEPGTAARHRTLRGAIGWSHELCTPAERTLWERLSVFAGPVTAEAAAQVCGGPDLDSGTVLSALIGLVDKSVLARAGGDVSRYRMLDSIREFGAERLAASGARSQARARHLHRYLGLAGELAARPLRDQVGKYQALRAEHADIRAALEYAVTLPPAGPAHPAIRLATDLSWYWTISGRNDEGRRWLTRALELVPEPGRERAAALVARGYAAAYLGDFGPALADTRLAITIADDLGDQLLGARGRAHLAYVLLSASRMEEARRMAEEAGQRLPRDLGDTDADLPVMLGVVQAYIRMLTGDPEGALGVCEMTLRLMPPDLGERWGSGYLYGLVGLALSLLGQPGEGNRACLRGLAMKQELGDAAGIAHCLGVAALISGAQKRHERTAWLIGANAPLWKKFGAAYIGVDIMQAFTLQAADEAREALGDERYAGLARDASARQLDQVIGLAIQDADRLPVLPPASR